MKIKVLIAHAKDEAGLAEKLAEPIRAAGYDVAHEGTVLIGESVVSEASKLLSEGVPVVLCGTVRAVGTKWGRLVVNAARRHLGVRIFVVQMEEEADVDIVAFDETIARYWQDNIKAEQDLITALSKYYPPESDLQQSLRIHDLESRYRQLALKACDIIDLANLPEDDRHLASRELELRRLYVALRMHQEIPFGDGVVDKSFETLESRRRSTWSDDGRRDDDNEKKPVSLGERLQTARQLVVLGDPGAGKSTLLRWLATAFLLRLQNDPNWRDLPDISSLPDSNWLPILIRCRDLPLAAADTLDDMLYHSLRKSELRENECKELSTLLHTKLQNGSALLLVDGLDEITEPSARTRFSQQLEQIHRVYPEAPMVVTSRIVGYREMGYRIRAGFEHLTVADLSRQDKDDFARRWCALTEHAERREETALDLIHDIHSSDRIERLTGNPMLLTTMALIKRKIGRLPQRRVDLYQKAAEVLLNWRSAVDAPLDPREALPQLEYLAHAMCSDGIQQIREDQALVLLRQTRIDYPHIHPLEQHTPEEFLSLLERRTGLLIQSGYTRHNGYSIPVYEFRHLTFQEYLAGIALVQGHYRGRDKDKSLAEAIAPLAGLVGEIQTEKIGFEDTAVVENWREVLRLCLAACNDDDVEKALLSVLHPLPGETGTSRPRAVLAALCLADEPNISEDVARKVLQALAAQAKENDGSGNDLTSLDTAAQELAASRWANILDESFLDEFLQRETESRNPSGGIFSMTQERKVPNNETEFYGWLTEQAQQLADCSERNATAIALTIMNLAWRGKDCQAFGMVDGLIHQLFAKEPVANAAAWALSWINDEKHIEHAWHPNDEQLQTLLAVAASPACDSYSLRCFSHIFQTERTPLAMDALLLHLTNTSLKTRVSIVQALGAIGDDRATIALLARLQDAQENEEVRLKVAKALGQIKDPRAIDTLKTKLQDTQEIDDIRLEALIALEQIDRTQAADRLEAFWQSSNKELRCNALGKLAKTCEDRIDHLLLSRDFDALYPWLDPIALISADRIKLAAEILNHQPEDIRQRYMALAERFGLKLE